MGLQLDAAVGDPDHCLLPWTTSPNSQPEPDAPRPLSEADAAHDYDSAFPPLPAAGGARVWRERPAVGAYKRSLLSHRA